MLDLIELVSLTQKTKLKGSNLIGLILEPGTRMEQLYEAIASKKVSTDEEAILLFGAKGAEEQKNLSSLKNKLKDRLIDSIFLLDFKDPGFTSRQKAFFECYKKWSAAMMLLTRNAKITGIDLLEKLARHAATFEFTELSLDILRVLKLQYSTVDGDFKKYEAAKDSYQKYEQLWLNESKAEQYYQELMMRYTNSKSTKKEVLELAKTYYEELAPIMEANQSFKMHLFGRLIHLFIYNSVNDYKNTALLCEEAIAFFDKKPYDSGLPLQVFYYNLVVCYLQLREFEKGQDAIKRCEYFFEEGSFNWFKLQELFFLLAMHTGHYQNGCELYDKVINHPKFEEKQPQIKEMWRIFEACLYYLYKIGKVSEEEAPAVLKKFKPGKFFNNMPIFSKDKRGMNITILILQILYFIADQDYDKSIDRIEAIEKYLVRYLKEDDTARSNSFIKMLMQIPIGNFHRENVLRKVEKYFKALKGLPLEAANQSHEIEIIPYEVLWEYNVETLGTKVYQRKK
jgi:hypothetical protein